MASQRRRLFVGGVRMPGVGTQNADAVNVVRSDRVGHRAHVHEFSGHRRLGALARLDNGLNVGRGAVAVVRTPLGRLEAPRLREDHLRARRLHHGRAVDAVRFLVSLHVRERRSKRLRVLDGRREARRCEIVEQALALRRAVDDHCDARGEEVLDGLIRLRDGRVVHARGETKPAAVEPGRNSHHGLCKVGRAGVDDRLSQLPPCVVDGLQRRLGHAHHLLALVVLHKLKVLVFGVRARRWVLGEHRGICNPHYRRVGGPVAIVHCHLLKGKRNVHFFDLRRQRRRTRGRHGLWLGGGLFCQRFCKQLVDWDRALARNCSGDGAVDRRRHARCRNVQPCARRNAHGARLRIALVHARGQLNFDAASCLIDNLRRAELRSGHREIGFCARTCRAERAAVLEKGRRQVGLDARRVEAQSELFVVRFGRRLIEPNGGHRRLFTLSQRALGKSQPSRTRGIICTWVES